MASCTGSAGSAGSAYRALQQLIDLGELVQAVHTYQLSDEGGWVGGIGRILVLQLRDQQLHEHAVHAAAQRVIGAGWCGRLGRVAVRRDCAGAHNFLSRRGR